MSTRLKLFRPLPPEAEHEVKLLFAEWKEHYFPDGNMYDDVGNYVDVPFPITELHEIDRKFGFLGKRNPNQKSAESFFSDLRSDAAFKYWDYERRRVRRKKVLKIVLPVVIAVCAVLAIYSFM